MSGIDLVFVLGGRVRDVDFEGIRVGRLSKARQIVQIQVGLTRDVLAALEPGVTVLNLATQAIHVGAETLAAAGLDFSKDAALALLARPTTAAPLVGPAPQSAVVELHLADRPNGYSMTEITRVERLLERRRAFDTTYEYRTLILMSHWTLLSTG